MADSILRLRVSSEEYDNKLKRATEQLTRYADGCRKAGGTLQYVDDNVVEFTRSLGKMETTATTARGKVSELTKAYTELAVRYKNMTDEEKKGEYGKALAQSLDELKGRIQDGKSQLDDINKSINGGGGLTGALDNLAGKFGMSVQSLASWGTALAAAKGALGVAKDAFFASESTVDEWGRVMDSSKSLYEGFLTALNTGDISGYLSRIDSIVQAARAAYDELDRLGTMKTIQAPQMSAQQTENERIRSMIQTGRYIAPIDGRRNTVFNGRELQNGDKLTAGQIRALEKQLQNGMQKVVTLVGNEVAQTGRAIDAVYNRQAQELGMSLKEFRKGTSSMAEFDKRIKGAEDYRRYEREHTTYDERTGIGHRDASVNPFEQFAKWSTFRVDGQRYNDLVKLIQQRDQQAGQAYSMQSQAYRTMNRAEGVTLRQIMGGGSGGGSGKGGSGKTTSAPTYAEDSIAAQSALVSDLTKKWNEAGEDMRNGYLYQLIEAENKLKEMKDQQQALKDMRAKGAEKGISPIGLDDGVTKSIKEIENELAKNPIKLRVEVDTEKVKSIQRMAQFQKTLGNVADAVSSIGQAFNSIEDPAAKVAGTVAQAIATMALAYAQASAATSNEGWGWIAFAATGLATMMSSISAIHSATGYAQGGEIKGNSFSGDNLMAMGPNGLIGLNAGEIVLNKAQQSTLAQNLQNNGGGNFRLVGKLAGEDIILSAERAGKRMGYGQLMFWNGN